MKTGDRIRLRKLYYAIEYMWIIEEMCVDLSTYPQTYPHYPHFPWITHHFVYDSIF